MADTADVNRARIGEKYLWESVQSRASYTNDTKWPDGFISHGVGAVNLDD